MFEMTWVLLALQNHDMTREAQRFVEDVGGHVKLWVLLSGHVVCAPEPLVH